MHPLSIESDTILYGTAQLSITILRKLEGYVIIMKL